MTSLDLKHMIILLHESTFGVKTKAVIYTENRKNYNALNVTHCTLKISSNNTNNKKINIDPVRRACLYRLGISILLRHADFFTIFSIPNRYKKENKK